ncbi:hypothetical protein ACWO0M_003304 [Vibrio parahaemolyticus]
MKTWKVLISEQKCEGPIQSGDFDCNGGGFPSFTFVDTEKADRPQSEYKYLMIDTLAWDSYWKTDESTYIPQDLNDLPEYRQEESSGSARKISRLYCAIGKSFKMFAPSFEDTPEGAKLRIAQGRHRVNIITSLKIPAFPAAVPLSKISELTHLGIIHKA